MKRRDSTVLSCFSAPVMVATMMVESSLAVYSIWRYKFNNLIRLVTFLLFGLGFFQLCEFFVCTGYGGLTANQWSRLGFVAITTLPPLGIHIMHRLAEKPGRRLVVGSYVSMLTFEGFFLTYHSAFTGYQCNGNYVIFQMGGLLSNVYAIYYYGLLILGIIMGAKWANEFMSQKGKKAFRKLQTIRGLIIGYLVFLIPVTIANTISPKTMQGIPSIMCGFAVAMAFIVVFYVLPRASSAIAIREFKDINLKKYF